MIKNLNDLISIIVLLILFMFNIRIFVWAFIKKEDIDLKGMSLWQLIKDYSNNIEE